MPSASENKSGAASAEIKTFAVKIAVSMATPKGRSNENISA